MSKLFLLFAFYALSANLFAQKNVAPKPLFDDPVYHGAADPVIIYNKAKKKWWMLYTNRRASIDDSTVQWVHGTRIGIAESKDGRTWKYVDTCNINFRPDEGYTHWAPDVIENKGTYHMYLTYVPGTFKDWNHPRVIIHLTSKDLKNWNYQSTLKLVNEKVIDASVFKVNDTLWRMWYNNERMEKVSGMPTVKIYTTGLIKAKRLQQEERGQNILLVTGSGGQGNIL